MRLVGEERREFQRLRIDPPLPAWFGDLSVTLVVIGILGARIRHNEPIGDALGELRFTEAGDEVILRAEIIRRIGEAPDLEFGLRFLAAVGDSGDRLREFLARMVARAFETRGSVPKHSIPTSAPIDADRLVRGKDAPFLCYRLEEGRWQRHPAFLPEQPAAGFTVARWVDPDEVSRLCQVYEVADEEGRRLIKLFAELSVSDELEIPPSAETESS